MSQIRARHYAVRSQFLFYVKERIGRYYDLPQDLTAIARRVNYLLERDRFMCFPRGYEVNVRFVIARPQIMRMDLTQQVTHRFRAPQILEATWGEYFKCRKMRGIAAPDFLGRINGTMVCLTCTMLCHTLRAWQTGIYPETCFFKPDAVAGEPDPEPGLL